jgi:hypothetical protein
MVSSFTFKSAPTQATTDNYADVQLTLGPVESGVTDKTFIAPTSGPISLNWVNPDSTNTITVQVLAANDQSITESLWNIVSGPTDIAAGAVAHIELDLARYQFYRFQHKAKSGGNQGSSVLYGRQARI